MKGAKPRTVVTTAPPLTNDLLDQRPLWRFLDVLKNRANHPRVFYALERFGDLTGRELAIIAAAMETASIELGHVIEEARQNVQMREEQAVAR